MDEIIAERPEDIEYADAKDEKRIVGRELRATLDKWEKKDAEYKKAGFDIIYNITERKGKRETDIYILKGPDGYSVQVNGKTTIQERTRADCAKRAYLAGHIGYFTYVEICHGKAAAERAKKDPRILETLKKYGAAVKMY